MWLFFPILFFGLILLLLAGRVIATPLIYYNRWKARRAAREAREAAEEASRRESKRFEDGVGEYVRFEEIKVDNDASQATADGRYGYREGAGGGCTADGRSGLFESGRSGHGEGSDGYGEEQISDAVYEEIPD